MHHNNLDAHVCEVVDGALRSTSGKAALSSPVSRSSTMGNPTEWDSLSFVSVFLAVAAEFGIDVDDDDAIHFMSVESIVSFVAENR